jgi:DNA polymerase-3 subunit delta
MTPRQFLTHIRQDAPAPAYLFVGPEPFQRDWCRKALLERLFPDPEAREQGFTRSDLSETSLLAVLEDACSLSLFASQRLLWASSAEAALPRARPASDKPEPPGCADALARYLKDPTPGTVLVFESTRYSFEGDDKKKVERVREFFSAVPIHVELAPLAGEQARAFADRLARQAGLNLGPAELDLLVESLGGEAARIAAEIDKLRLWAASGKPVGPEQITELVPDARATTIFALVDALAHQDRLRALETLDTLVRQSEYLPLALAFLSSQFRAALAAKEAGLRSANEVRSHLSALGLNVWPSKAAQIHQTASAFSESQLAGALQSLFRADRSLRDARPDDRVVMEDFILHFAG